LTGGLEFLNKDFLVSAMVHPVSYGMNSDFSDYKIMGIGLSGNKSKGLHFLGSPVMMNLNKMIKPLRNTYVGPVVDFDSMGNFGLGLSLQLGL
jgi:hypothetical protein